MNIFSPKSRIAIANLLADFILSKIPKDETSVIQVVDCVNFFVIKGKTTSQEILNISTIIDEIKSLYTFLLEEEKYLTHTIDLIEYDSKIDEIKTLKHKFYNTEVCNFNKNQIYKFSKDNTKSYCDDNIASEFFETLCVSSNFPHGYSINSGRLLYYFAKNIIYNIPSNYPFEEITLIIDSENENFLVFDEVSREEDLTLKSAILDCVNFDKEWLIEEIKKVDWCSETTDPLSEYEFVKRKIEDFIII